ncbi:transporter [Parelaphostrongylus tenuis]|uniref:Transporter n=1 Tax=Parelaphostrongylus tenuis TaxID=148309 RepID=A0AAD5R1K0_PARTN|nr:transporter [Parelaphostrongylus tenuis]
MLRIPQRNNTKWEHLRVREKFFELFGPCGVFIRTSWILICPCFLMILMFTQAASYKRPLLLGRHVPLASELTAWTLMCTPLMAVVVGAIVAIMRTRQSGKKISSLFDSSSWHQEEGIVRHVDLLPSQYILPKRENTYMYIDRTSRDATIRSACLPCVDNYGWRNGRLREWQETVSLVHSPSQPSFAASLASQATLTLFGSPPASNGFMISDTKTVCKSWCCLK